MISLVLNPTSSDKIETNSTSESDEGYEIIEYKGKDYILEDNKIYNINDNETKQKLYGS